MSGFKYRNLPRKKIFEHLYAVVSLISSGNSNSAIVAMKMVLARPFSALMIGHTTSYQLNLTASFFAGMITSLRICLSASTLFV